MTAQHWNDLARRKAANERRAPTHSQTLTPPREAIGSQAAERAAAQNPQLRQLLEERAALEERMNAAIGGGALSGVSDDPRDALRFQVASMAQRRAEYEHWASRRDQLEKDATTPDQSAQTDMIRQQLSDGEMVEPALRITPGETPRGSSFLAKDWLQQRSKLSRRRGVGGPKDEGIHTRLDQRLRRARETLRDTNRKLRDADFDHGTEAREKGGRLLSKARALSDSYRAAERKVEDDWLTRRDEIGGADMQSYMRPLRELNDKVLGMGMPDIEERAARLREAAINKRRAARAEEAADTARRERAVEKRRMAADGF